MAITPRDPNTIWLSGDHDSNPIENTIVAKEAITPGHLIETINDAGTLKYQKHATAGGLGATYALDQSMLNRGVADAYGDGDLVEALLARPGDKVWAFLASGQNVVAGAKLQSAGNGMLTAGSSSEIARAMEAKNATGGDSRLRIEVI